MGSKQYFFRSIDFNSFTYSLKAFLTSSLYKTLNFLTPEMVERAICAQELIFLVMFTILIDQFVPQMENF